MWLEAFKPKSGNIQKNGVTGVTGVTGVALPGTPNEYVGIAISSECHTGKTQSVAGGTKINSVPPATPCDTGIKTKCNSDAPTGNPNEYAGCAVPATPATPVTPQKHSKPENKVDTAEVHSLFRFDLVQEEIEAGFPEFELRRVNNIAWRLITARGYMFDEAITAAAQWVAGNPPHRDEATFIDVMALFERIK